MKLWFQFPARNFVRNRTVLDQLYAEHYRYPIDNAEIHLDRQKCDGKAPSNWNGAFLWKARRLAVRQKRYR